MGNVGRLSASGREFEQPVDEGHHDTADEAHREGGGGHERIDVDDHVRHGLRYLPPLEFLELEHQRREDGGVPRVRRFLSPQGLERRMSKRAKLDGLERRVITVTMPW